MANRRFIDFPIAASVGDNDIVLIWQDGMNKQTTKGTLIQGAPTSLEGLTDVDIAGLINGQILQYNSTTGKWENVDRTDINLSELGDVSIVSPTNGQVLVYNSSTSKWENSSGGFVPYVGAVTTVDLGAQGLRAGYVRFNTSVVSVPDEQGIMYWDADNETVDVILNGTIMQIGQDLFYPVKNQTGSTIPKGTAVRFAGTVGNSGRLLIAPFIANNTVPSSRFMGVTSEAILDGADGKVMWFGRIRGINTNSFNEGDILYASTTTAGAFQTTIPVAPNNIVQVAAVVTKSINQGAIFVRPTIGSNINKDEGVKITSVADKDLLQYQSGTALWENKTLAQVIGSAYVPSTRTITINGTTQDLSANRTYNVGTVTSVGLSSATSGVTIGSTPVTGSGTITIAIATASGSQNGLLSSTDWTTFNNKQNALTNPVTGTGTTNYLPKFTGSTTIGNSNLQDSGSLVTINSETKLLVGANATRNLFFGTSATNYGRITYNDATGELAIGTIENYSLLFATQNTTKMTLTSGGNLGLGVTPSAASLPTFENQYGFLSGQSEVNLTSNAYFNSGFKFIGGSNFALRYHQSGFNGSHQWLVATGGTAGNAITFTQAMTLTSGGNLLVGTTTDSGYKLDVNGTGRFSGALTVSGTSTLTGRVQAIEIGVTRNGADTIGDGPWYRWTNAAQDRQMLTQLNASNGLTTWAYNGSTWTSVYTLTQSGAATFSSSVTTNANEGFIIAPSSGASYMNYKIGSTSYSLIGIAGTTSDIIAGSALGDLNIRATNSQKILFSTNNGGSAAMTITSGGNVLIGTTTNGASKLRLVGLPTSAVGLSSGDVYNLSGVLMIA